MDRAVADGNALMAYRRAFPGIQRAVRAAVASGGGGGGDSGWTDLDALINSAPYASSRIVYVSTSGSDATGQVYSPASAALGGNPTNPTGTIAPYATLAAARPRFA